MGGRGVGCSAPPPLCRAGTGQVALWISSYGEGEGTVLQLYVDDHTPFTKLTVYMPCLYITMYMLMYVYYTFLYCVTALRR
jgi:hypothetical protein